MTRKKSKSKIIAEKTIFETFKILKANGGEMRGKEVVDKIRETVEFNEYEKEQYEKTGYIRWESILHFYTIDCLKAGFLLKEKGLWILTKEGENAIKLGAEELLSTATKIYREWDAQRKQQEDKDKDDDVPNDKGQEQEALIDQLEDNAISGIRSYILDKNPYQFQDIVAALLNSMGYHISEVAKRGPDGGIDIIAYNDPLGTTQPRIIVQVKHKPTSKISADEIQKLAGTLKRTSDVGIFVTSGDFTKPAKNEARNSREHIELIGFDRFVKLWTEYYYKMEDEQKNMLPLHPIYFLGSNS